MGYQPLTIFLKKLYDAKISKVIVSPRVETTPCILVTSQYGNSANMERIMRSQAFIEIALFHASLFSTVAGDGVIALEDCDIHSVLDVGLGGHWRVHVGLWAHVRWKRS